MPEFKPDAQAISNGTRSRGSRATLHRVLSAAIAIAVLAIAAAPVATPTPVAQANGVKPKAVVIVGPTGGSTDDFLAKGRAIADQAEAAGMDVRRIFHPRATPERVLENIQGAKFVLYLGHGNGWPSPYAPFQERTKNGFGLNPVEGGSASNHVYRGANWIRQNIKLAKHAFVLIVGACYASGNGEPGMPIPSESVARERVDNFASGFLYSGASVVFGHGWQPKANFPQMLMTTNKTFDEMFMTPANGLPFGFVGWRNKYFQSSRTAGATVHLDPHPSYGYYRGATGWLNVTANQWRGTDGSDAVQPPPAPTADTTAPSIPADFTATAGSGLVSNLAWSASTDDRAGTIKYRVLRNGTRIATTANTTFTDRPSKAGTYRYKVRAVDAAGNLSGFTAELSVTVGTTSSSSASAAPSAPTGLRAEALGYRRVQLTWNASSSAGGGTLKYRVVRNGRRIATVTSLSFIDRPANPGTYNYKVRAVDGSGQLSEFSVVVTGRAVRGSI